MAGVSYRTTGNFNVWMIFAIISRCFLRINPVKLLYRALHMQQTKELSLSACISAQVMGSIRDTKHQKRPG
jgi:hypothetical protein